MIDTRVSQLKITGNEVHSHSIADVQDLAFDHKSIMDTCLKKLRVQIMDEPIVFNLLPEKFSLRELQDLYQSILGIKLDRRNFRKKIALKNWLNDLNEIENDVPHRPGKLYKLNSGLKNESSKR